MKLDNGDGGVASTISHIYEKLYRISGYVGNIGTKPHSSIIPCLGQTSDIGTRFQIRMKTNYLPC